MLTSDNDSICYLISNCSVCKKVFISFPRFLNLSGVHAHTTIFWKHTFFPPDTLMDEGTKNRKKGVDKNLQKDILETVSSMGNLLI